MDRKEAERVASSEPEEIELTELDVEVIQAPARPRRGTPPPLPALDRERPAA